VADIAEIGFKAQTGELSDAKRKMEELSPAAGKAERATNRLSRMFGSANDNSRKFADSVKGSSSAVGLLSTGIGRAVAALTAFAAAVFAALSLRNFTQATIETAQVQAQLAAALVSTGGAAGRSISQLNDHAAALQNVTMFGDEAINSMQALLLTFTNVRGNTFDRATASVTDYATAMKTDLRSAALQVGKALNDPVLGMSALGRAGVQFTEAQKEAVKQMVATNDMAGAQNIVLKELEKQFGGSAKAARETLGGALQALRNSWGDLFELTGPGVESLRLAIEGLVEAIKQPGFFAFVQMIGTALFGAFELAIRGATLLANGINFLSDYAYDASIALAILFGPAILSASAALITNVIGLTVAIGVGLVKALAAASLAMLRLTLSNPFTAIIYGVSLALAAIYVFRDSIDNVFDKDITGVVKKAANIIIGSFVAAYHDIVFVWSNFGNIMGAAVIGGVNAAIRAINVLLQKAGEGIDWLIDKINNIPGVDVAKVGGGAGLSEMANPGADALTGGGRHSAVSRHLEKQQGALTADYLGTISAGIDTMTEKLTVATGAAAGLNEELGGGGGKGGGKEKKDPYREIVEGAQRTIAALEAERAAVGLSEEAALRLTRQTDLLNQAKQKNIDLSPRQRDELMKLGSQMAQLEIETNKAKDALDFAREGTKSFISDLRKGLMDGKSFWESFKNAAMNALDKIIDKLLNNFIDAIFQANSAASGLGGGSKGGFLGGILGGIGKLFGFAKGGAFAKGISGHSNTVVSKPTLFKFASGGGVMGEAGPEGILPLKRGPDGSLGVQMYNDRGGTRTDGGKTMHLEQHYHIEGAISSRDVQQMVQAGMSEAVDTAKRKLPEWQMTYGTDGAVT